MADGGTSSVFLRLLAERAAADPAFLAWVVQTYAETESRPTADVLTQLGVEGTATDFLLSLRPAGTRFAEMLRAICTRFGAQEALLLTVLRQVEVLDAFRAAAGNSSGAGAVEAGLLMAARMREEGSRPRRVTEQVEPLRDHDRDHDRRDDRDGGDGGDGGNAR